MWPFYLNYCLLEALEDNHSLAWVDLRCYGAAFPFLSTIKILKIWVLFLSKSIKGKT